MKKIAIAVVGKSVANHFGHCDVFYVFDVEEKEIKNQTIIPNPGHQPGFLPRFLSDQGVNVIVSGGMGKSAIDLFQEQGIVVYTGAAGDPNQVLLEVINQTLSQVSIPCLDHIHEC